MAGITIDIDMKAQAKIEGERRHNYITHHFNVNHLTNAQRDEIGFLGEFAFNKFLGLDWKQNIRENYLTIDDFDLEYMNKRIDVKTETVPFKYAPSIYGRTIDDNALYGRRLINQGQWSLLHKYDIVVFGLFIRDMYSTWYPIGFLETSFILQNYRPTFSRPDGGKYPFAAAPIKTSDLRSVDNLKLL